MEKLSDTSSASTPDAGRISLRATPKEQQPISGWLAVGCGILGIFGPGLIFTPLGLIFSIVALFRGQGVWAFAGLLLAVAGFLTSPLLMTLVGASALFVFVDWNDLMAPIYQWMSDGLDV